MQTIDSEEKAIRMARICDRLKGEDIVILQVGDLCSFTDYIITVTGLSAPHVRALSETLLLELKKDGVQALGVEGERSPGWILVDYGDVVVHLFLNDKRRYYNLERLWGDAPAIEWAAETALTV